MEQVKAIKLTDNSLVKLENFEEVIVWEAKDGTLHANPQQCQEREIACAIEEYLTDVRDSNSVKAKHIVDFLVEWGYLNINQTWVNVYFDGTAYLHPTRESADECAGNRVTCAQILPRKELEV